MGQVKQGATLNKSNVYMLLQQGGLVWPIKRVPESKFKALVLELEKWTRKKMESKKTLFWAAAIAQWIHLHLPYGGPGFKSQVQHLCFFNL